MLRGPRALSSASAALFGIRGLGRPEACLALARDAARTTDRLVGRIVAQRRSPTVGVLHDLDAVSEELCRVLDAMELCRNVHPDPDWVDAADAAYAQLSAHMQALNTEPRLYEAIDALLQAPRLRAELSAEQMRFARSIAAEFEHDGVHLSAAERSRLGALHADADRLAVQFSQGRGEGEPLQVLQRLLERRHEIATALGHSCWASYACSHNRMQPDHVAVQEALVALMARLQPHAAAELRLLGCDKRRASGSDGALREGDVAYYMGARRAAAAASADGEISMYLELQSCLDGLELVLSRSFGLRLERAAVADGELWHPSVRKLLLVREGLACGGGGGEAVGILYLDLFGRARKSRQAALFTLRASAARRPPPAAASMPAATVAASPALQLGLPAAALVCELPSPRADGCDERSGQALLQPSALETLYHEVGHALHALLSRTEFQHLSGVRAPLDFVETPALLMEHFAREPRVLRSWATHARSGAPLPLPVAQQLCASRDMFLAVEWQGQGLRALLDLQLHSDVRHASPEQSTALVHALATRHTVLPAQSGARWHASFSHLASYGAAYFAYLWARSLSRRVWKRCFAGDPLQPDAGSRWCDMVLRHGGAREPRQMLRELLAASPPPPAAAGHEEQEDEVKAALEALVSLEAASQSQQSRTGTVQL